MGEIVNLNKVRKKKIREQRSAKAEENRIRFGRSGEARRKERDEKRLSDEKLEGHRMDAGSGQAEDEKGGD